LLLGTLVDAQEGLVKVKVKVKAIVEEWMSYLLDCFTVGKREVVEKQFWTTQFTTMKISMIR